MGHEQGPKKHWWDEFVGIIRGLASQEANEQAEIDYLTYLIKLAENYQMKPVSEMTIDEKDALVMYILTMDHSLGENHIRKIAALLEAMGAPPPPPYDEQQ